MPYDYPTSSPTSGLAAGLARGIFGNWQREEQEAKDRTDAERDRSLKFLYGLLDKVEPESLPELYKQIGNTMGLKGKHRGIWDMLTGQGRENDREAIQQSQQDVLGRLMGPKTAKELRGGPAPVLEGAVHKAQPLPGTDSFIGGLRIPEMPIGEATPNRMPPGRLVLRDPRAEHLEDLKTQYGLQLKNREEQIAFQQEQMFDRQWKLQQDQQKFLMDKQEDAFSRKARAEVDARAFAIARDKGFVQPQFEHTVQAAHEVADKYGMNRELLKARIGVAQSTEERNRALAEALKKGEGLNPGQAAADRARKFDDAARIHKEWKENRDAAVRIGNEYHAMTQELEEFAKSLGDTYNTTTGTFGKPATSIRAQTFKPGLVQKEQAAKKAEAEAKAKVKANWDLMGTDYFKDHFKRGAHEWEAELLSGPTASLGAGIGATPLAPTGQAPASTYEIPPLTQDLNLQGQGNVIRSTIPMRIGEKVIKQGKAYRVEKAVPSNEPGILKYHLVPIE